MDSGVFLLFILFLGAVRSEAPFISSVSYQTLSSSVLGVDISLGVFHVEFDQPLYFNEIEYCVPGCMNESSCEPCDFTLPDQLCGSVGQNSTSRGCECSEEKNKACGGSNTWNTLVAGQTLTNQIISTIPVYYRFQVTERCSGIRVHINTLVGAVFGSVNWGKGPLKSGEAGDIALQGSPFTLCPHNPAIRLGTVYFAFWAGFMSNISITVSVFDTQQFVKLPTEGVSPCPDDPSQNCPKQGTITKVTALAFAGVRFRMRITSCQLFFFHYELIGTDSTTQTSAGIVIDIQLGLPIYFLDSVRPTLLSICPQEDGQPFTFFAQILGGFTADWLLILNVYDDKLFPAYRQIPLDELVSYDFRAIDEVVHLNCSAHDFFCLPGCPDIWGCCTESWTVLPVQETTPLFPLPRALQHYNSELFGNFLEWKEQAPDNSQRTTYVVAFEINDGFTPKHSMPNWRTTLEIDCSIGPYYYWSRLTSSNGTMIRNSVSLQGKRSQQVCDYENFTAVSDVMSELIDHFDPTSNSQRYQIDELTFSDAWQSCITFANSLMSPSSSIVTIHDTDTCPDSMVKTTEDSQSVCCDTKKRWEACCQPRDINVTEIIVSPSSEKMDSSSCQSICLPPLANDYSFYSNLLTSSRGCSSAVHSDPQILRRDGLLFYQICKARYFGEDGVGTECVSNAECPSQHCDITKMLCVFDNHQQYLDIAQQFFDCIVTNMTSSMRSYILKASNQTNTQGRSPRDDSQTLMNVLQTQYMRNSCLADYGPSARGLHVSFATVTSTCLTCNSTCLDKWCPIPIGCEFSRRYGRPKGLCATSFLATQTQDQTGCEEELVCGWNSALSPEECVINPQPTQRSEDQYRMVTMGQKTVEASQPFVCVVCETPISCIPIPGVKSQDQCLNSKFCLSGNRSVAIGLSDQQCQNFGTCTLACPNCTKQQCVATGRCSDQDLIEYLQQAEPIVRFYNQWYHADDDAYCWNEMAEWNDPDCGSSDISNTHYRPFNGGCLLVMNQSTCASNFAKWTKTFHTQQDCEAQENCIEPRTVYTELRTHKNSSQCSLCTGGSAPVFNWESAQWVPGKQMKGQWIPMNTTLSKDYWANSIDFLGLADIIEQATQANYYLQLETELYCRLNPTRALLQQMSCVCDVTVVNQTSCFDQSTIDIGVGRVCPNIPSQLFVPPSVLNFNNDSVIGDCVDFSVNTLIADTLSNHNQPSISTSFKKIDTNQDPVKNSNGAFIGQLLGNGVKLVTTDQSKTKRQVGGIQHYRLCVDIPDLDSFWDQKKYPKLDFSKRENAYVVPLGLNVDRDGITICADIISSNVRLEIYPIAKEEHWDTATGGLSQGELATFVVMCLLYTFVLAFGMYCEWMRGFQHFLPIRWVALFLNCLCLVRAVYFLLLAVSVFGKGNTPTTEFVFVEVPTFLYLNGLLVDLILWVEVGFVRFWKKQTMLYHSMFIFVLSSIIVVVSVVVAWFFLSAEGTYHCAGRVYEQPSTKNQDIVTYVYRGVITTVAIFVAIFMVVASRKAIQTIGRTMKRSLDAEAKSAFLKNVQRIGMVASTSLIAQCIFFVVYTAVGNIGYGYAFILLPVELFPVLFLLVVISFAAAKKNKSSSDKKTSSLDGDISISRGRTTTGSGV